MTKKKKIDLETLEAELQTCQERERRALADYQNLIRRQQDERASIIKLASKGLVGDLLLPLEHLSLAAEQLNDSGLEMVIKQFWQVLKQHGLQEIVPELGGEFRVEEMEAVEEGNRQKAARHGGDAVEGRSGKIKKVIRKGYKLNGEVLQFAKVVVGE